MKRVRIASSPAHREIVEPIPLTIHNTGTVASIATTIFVGAQRRLCSPNGMFMMHPVTVGAKAQSLAIKPLVESLQAAVADETRTESILRAHTQLPDAILGQRRETDVYIPAPLVPDHKVRLPHEATSPAPRESEAQ